MFKRIALPALAFLLSAPLAYAVSYKGENNYHSRAHYKGELVSVPVLREETPPPAAETIPCQTYTFDSGFYLGISPGIVTTYSISGLSVYKGFQGSLFAGYAFVRSNFYLAAELFAQRDAELQNYPNNVNANGNTVGLRSTYGGGFSLLPGLILADTVMAYLRLGEVTTHFQDTAQTKTGGQVGIGLQVAVSESWNVRCEYSYAFYPSLTTIAAPRSDTYHIGLIYKI